MRQCSNCICYDAWHPEEIAEEKSRGNFNTGTCVLTLSRQETTHNFVCGHHVYGSYAEWIQATHD